jgi:hypothetical protein
MSCLPVCTMVKPDEGEGLFFCFFFLLFGLSQGTSKVLVSSSTSEKDGINSDCSHRDRKRSQKNGQVLEESKRIQRT